jgi:23S rRNA (cytosine1962-C5)-methyltransferase
MDDNADFLAPEPAVLKAGREKPLLQHHPWVFSGALASIPASAPDGALVDVVSHDRRRWLARGYLNRASQIPIRLLTWDENEAIDPAFWQRRLAAAVERRAPLLIPGPAACRLVHGENDYLPGLIVDQYADVLVLQAGTLAIDRRKRALAEMLLGISGGHSVVERSDSAARRLEGLPPGHGLLAGSGPPPAQVEIVEAGLRFIVDLSSGQKTGFYLDQRANRRKVAAYCSGARVLNGFSYTGAFAVHALAAGAKHVTNIDSSVDVLELAETNLQRNGFEPDRQTENVAGDIFQILRDWRDTFSPDERFDVAILDPPKFAQNKQQVERALRGYKDINLLALHLLKPGGVLATFSCSGLVSADLFQKVVFGAAVDAGRDVQILEWLRQDSDHPVAITFPEGEYLKGLICRVL